MLNRQRALLELLREAGGRASRLQATKWLFLVRAEAPGRGGTAFYEFVPYQHGPFSFCLYQEASSLRDQGYLTDVDEQTWELAPAGNDAAAHLPPPLRGDLAYVLGKHRHRSVQSLLDYVYERYPWFTVNSLRDPRCIRPKGSAVVHTAGYGGLSVDGFLNGLLREGIERVIDVRHNPVSRRYGFHKGTLSRLCGKVGVDYRHFPELGIPSEKRRDIDGLEARETLFAWYRESVLPRNVASIERVAGLMTERPSVLLCAEANPAECHRSHLALQVARQARLAEKHLCLTA